jgi:putative Mg2+ transporter-C (MgtC) family protein
MHYFTDMARIGAQVVAGIGFIGAGTIIVTKRRRVKGLTTAAGLWTNAIIGLSAGAGFYEGAIYTTLIILFLEQFFSKGAIYTTLIILFLEQFFSKWEYRMLRSAREINLYVEYEHRETLESILQKLREMEVKISDLEVTRSSKEGAKRGSACAVISLMLSKNHPSDEVMNAVSVLEGVLFVEEL